MRGKRFYFFALREDYIEAIKEVEEKLGGLRYVRHMIYKEPKFQIYDSIEKIPHICLGELEKGDLNTSKRYFIAKKEEEFLCEIVNLQKGGHSYLPEDPKGYLVFTPGGLYVGTDCIASGELSTVAEDESRQEIFKEMKKAMGKYMMLLKEEGIYVGKSLIENKGRYRLIDGAPEYADEGYDISSLDWNNKGRRKKK
ncbi:hypothetical protein C4N15_02295 [Fusobacterium necrophorum subsp. funduliforme]|uniref:hypothetical protein n=1 Tax=Fusobacterium necrophorum TaxID=859 RepID=UPI000245DD02|nr:hypothetical protein [Fusobacterium necrophorum]AVQ20529.1 hypothetical protein C4N15_02295 [Fusobacterium necrophorum subsp. funduliforme]EHO20646.1 hypothetical protein HMPREF9466_00937 [Fusobacterium necrophorum subsp. funduliforme 1_1_36S]